MTKVANPDVVLASAGDIPTQEALAAVALPRADFPDLTIRYINVVDLFKLQPITEHPHGRKIDSIYGRQTNYFQFPRLSTADSPLGLPSVSALGHCPGIPANEPPAA
jgi:hypothetical protein